MEVKPARCESWSKAVSALHDRHPHGFGFIHPEVYDHVATWLDSRLQTDPLLPPTCIIATLDDGLEVDFRDANGDLILSAEFFARGGGELTHWNKTNIVGTEPIQ